MAVHKAFVNWSDTLENYKKELREKKLSGKLNPCIRENKLIPDYIHTVEEYEVWRTSQGLQSLFYADDLYLEDNNVVGLLLT